MAFDRNRRGRKRRKVCVFCVDKVQSIDYKDTAEAAPLYLRARQDPAPSHHRHLRDASASADHRH